MNRFLKILSLVAALLIGVTLLVGCRDEKDIAQKLEMINEGLGKAISDESGETLIYRTVKLESDIEGVLENSSEETFVVFTNNNGSPDFELTRDYTATNTGEVKKYQFVKEGDVMIELFDGAGDYVETAPDIFAQFTADFDASDVKSMEITTKEKGFKEYRFYMKAAYVDGFDSEADGLKKDCVAIAYCYYVDNYTNLSNILREYVYTVTYNGESQEMIEFIDAKID